MPELVTQAEIHSRITSVDGFWARTLVDFDRSNFSQRAGVQRRLDAGNGAQGARTRGSKTLGAPYLLYPVASSTPGLPSRLP